MPTHKLDTLCDALGATYSITRDANVPTVRVVLALPTGDSMAGNGATTPEAVEDLVAKCKKFDLLPAEVAL